MVATPMLGASASAARVAGAARRWRVLGALSLVALALTTALAVQSSGGDRAPLSLQLGTAAAPSAAALTDALVAAPLPPVVASLSLDAPLIFHHQRKAGGTSLRSVLMKAAQDAGLSAIGACYGLNCDSYSWGGTRAAVYVGHYAWCAQGGGEGGGGWKEARACWAYTASSRAHQHSPPCQPTAQGHAPRSVAPCHFRQHDPHLDQPRAERLVCHALPRPGHSPRIGLLLSLHQGKRWRAGLAGEQGSCRCGCEPAAAHSSPAPPVLRCLAPGVSAGAGAQG